MAPSPCRPAIYPGTFDPLTFGHVSLVKRGLTIFPSIVVGVAKETGKETLFSLEERVALAEEAFKGMQYVSVEPFEGLLVDYVARHDSNVILRGLRAVSDFEFEFQMALMNRRLAPATQTVFLMTDYRWLYISSTIVKRAAKAGGDVRGMLPDNVYFALMERLKEREGAPGA